MKAKVQSLKPIFRPRPIVHLPLVLLSIIFFFPFAWLLVSSLMPREQTGAIPPKWLPRMYYIQLDGAERTVTAPRIIDRDSVVIIPQSGPRTGEKVLIEKDKIKNGTIKERFQTADRVSYQAVQVKEIQDVPAGQVIVWDWILSKYDDKVRSWYCLPADEVKSRVQPVWGNYPEAIKALTAGEKNKKLTIRQLIKKSVMPWTLKLKGKTITFITYLLNTLTIALLGMIGTLLSSSLAAYGLSKIRWKGRNVLFIITISTMMVPFPVLMIPLYSVFRTFGWIGTLKPLWVPTFFGGAFNIFLLRQFFITIPDELFEAARIDGCSEFGIFRHVALPLAKPALAVVALFYFLFAWNDFLGPVIYLTQPETYTLALGLQQYQSQLGGSEWHLLMAASALLVIPIIILFFFTQKTFIQGISTTGLKG